MTTPSRTMPGTRSSIFSTPSAKVAVLKAGRGSRPGFSSSRRMSVTVGSPNVSSTKSSGRSARSVVVLPIRERMSPPAGRSRCAAPPGRPRGARPEASSGSSPPGMRRKPAHCSNAFGPSRGTSFSADRFRNGPLLVAVADDVLGQALADARHPGAAAAAEAVLTSTPTALTQSSTTASRERDSFSSGHVVLVLADADRLGVDLDQLGQRVLEAAGDRHRAPQRDVEAGQLLARRRPRRSTPRRRPRRRRPW